MFRNVWGGYRRMVASITTSALVMMAATAVVSPSSSMAQVYPNHVHSDYNGIPFWVDTITYQQVFAAGQFGSSPIQIHSLAFAPDSFYNGEELILSSLVIRLGYTDKAPGGLSTTLASNPRGSMTEVLNRPGYHTIIQYGGSENFSLLFQFTTPFCYDPSNGNLLLEIYQVNNSLAIATSSTFGMPDSSRALNSQVFGNFTDTVATRIKFELTSCGTSGLTLSLGGACPGTINVGWTNATPNKQMGIVYARNTGNFVLPGGVCAGTHLGLGSNQLQLVNTVNTGGSGHGSVNGNAGLAACGGYIQLVVYDGNPCTVSNVVQLP